MMKYRSLVFHGALVLGVTALSGCSSKDDAANKPRPVPKVGFVVIQPSAVPIPTSLGGRVVASETSEVRPQITGVVQRRLFTEGSTVRAGQPLFQIDPSLYRAAVDQASANLASARATVTAAGARAERFKPLAELEAVSKQDYADALATAQQARASVAQTGALLETARTNLRFTTLPAPITGKIGRSLFTVGALVSANQANPLAVIQKLDPIFVDVQQSSAELLGLKRALASGGATRASTQVHLQLEDGSQYGRVGTVEFADVTVNAATGTVTLRAIFPNPDGVLLPGMFVQAKFDQAVDQRAFLVPQQALQRDLGGVAIVLLVGPDNKVVRRQVKAERTYGANWVVTGGLKAGDKVITQGTNNLRQGAEIKPVLASTPQKVEAPKKGAGDAQSGQSKQGG